MGAILGQLGVGFGLNSLFLKYSRDAESQADLMGTQILHDSGYDPRAMVDFFEKLQAVSKDRTSQFFSDHPVPENRISNVQKEMEKLGGAPPNPLTDSPDFHSAKTLLAGWPAGRGGARPASRPADARNGRAPELPSGGLATYNGVDLQLRYPDNWRPHGDGSVVTFAPDGGIVAAGLAWGMMFSTFEPDTYGRDRVSLDEATDQLLNSLQRSNSSMRITRTRERTHLAGQDAQITEASNQSPAGGRETDWIVTTIRPDGTLQYFIGVAPQNDFDRYATAFQDVIDSVGFK